MLIKKVPQSCHSGKRWIWILEALSSTNPSKKLTVPTISGFTMGHPQLATRLQGTGRRETGELEICLGEKRDESQ